LTNLKNIIALSAMVLFLLILSGCTARPPEAARTEKDYTGVSVSSLPLDEQIKIASSVELSAVVNWGEGGPTYSREVVEAFLLGYPRPDYLGYLEDKHGKYEPVSPGERANNAMAFLSQSTDASGIISREAWIYVASGCFQIGLHIDKAGDVYESSISFMGNDALRFERLSSF